MRVARTGSWLCAAGFALVPLYPSFITLTGVTAPGESLLSRTASIALLCICAAIGAALIVLLLRAPRGAPPTFLPLVAWLAAALAASLLGFSPMAGMVFLGIYVMAVIWHVAIARFCAVHLAPVLWALAASSLGAGAAALVMMLSRRPAELYAIAHGRAVGTFVLPGELAGYLIVVLPVMYALAQHADSRALRTACAASLACGIAAFALTFSRAGWVGLAAAIACYAVWSGTLRRRFAPLVVGAGVCAVLLLFNVRHNPAENYTRLSIWQAGLEIARRFPLTGVGPFNFARIYPLVRLPAGDVQAFHAHDLVLTMFAETGVAGVAALLWVWWRFGSELRVRIAGASARRRAVALAIAAGLAGTWVQGLLDTVSVVLFGLWLPMMALALAVCRAPERAA